jgi:hypothetical protein
MGPAQWVQYDFDTDSPELLATIGWGHSIHSSPLRARPRPYPIAPLTKKEHFLFHTEQVFTPLVDTALDRERDVGLRAEVQRYRRMTQRARSLTYRLVDLKAEYNEARTKAHESATHLAYADAHDRLMTKVLTEVMEDQTLAPRIRQQGLTLINDSDAREPRQRASVCEWCVKTTHDSTMCSMLRQCMLCQGWGHLEDACHAPHRLCQCEEMCRVSRDHPRYRLNCRGYRQASRGVRR